ncbi:MULTISPECIES: ABC transporter ATP-binding protein [Comamonas]|uniref:ABC transporter ATP-binding protein n=1 Tax=Comamonas TaxID=283 RepID=UPI00050FC4BF|nr:MULTISPECIES: ATP-binding cassette domain-containing protein [Comamonas]KGG94338.1 ABC transporter [Comamonas thiooxydans]KGH00172.1 ABC transporter [Comamonas thiooxydans]KGH06832.1 ABC transporter [Comamonas thiooxydans]KGH14992.1 ABC transporter [Comamonas thiooxydans]TZG08593.1 ATP-binding cassette domain-containing protein [Comamonas thiooxydans]
MNSELDDGCESLCMVQALQVSFGYPGRVVAHEASHCWHAGLCLLQGDEGTGKTSWLKALAGQLPLRMGLLHYPFADNGRLAASSCFWQDPRQPLNDVYSQMPAESWVALQRTLYPHWLQQQFEQHVQGFGLEPHLHKPLLALSSGTQRKLWMAAGWASAAELVLIDEPLAALDKPSERYVQHALAAMAAELKNPARPRSVIVAHWDAMQGVDWEDVMELATSP